MFGGFTGVGFSPRNKESADRFKVPCSSGSCYKPALRGPGYPLYPYMCCGTAGFCGSLSKWP